MSSSTRGCFHPRDSEQPCLLPGKRPPFRPRLLALCCAGLLSPLSAAADLQPGRWVEVAPEGAWAACPAYSFYFIEPDPPLPIARGELTGESETALADEATVRLEGNVRMHRDGRYVAADRIDYDRRSETAIATGTVHYQSGPLHIDGQRAVLVLPENRGEISPANWHLRDAHAFGRAERVVFHDADRQSLEQAGYSTCQPHSRTWSIHASRIDLDHERRQGVARNATLRIKDTPVAWTPYLRFPLGSERLSGFLAPSWGSSDRHGFELATPYYWNIAPHRDATITPHLYGRRGLMLRNEFRYLNPSSHGIVEYDLLPHDRQHGSRRERGMVDHRGHLGDDLRYSLLYNRVRDDDHLDDFGGGQRGSSRHLPQQATLAWSGLSDWSVTGLVQRHQTVHNAEEPYRRLPQLRVRNRHPERNRELNYHLDSEFTRFEHSEGGRIDGDRLDLRAGISWPVRGVSGFIVPRLTVYHSRYQLNNQAAGLGSSPNRTVPVASLDSGLFFERDTRLAGRDYLHTLEPRLFYLHAPYRAQHDLPNFDTGERSFGTGALFSENRFIGRDRVGDANQVTLAVTTRLLEPETGVQRLSATVGQIRHFSDRRVRLDGVVRDRRRWSDVLGQTDAQFSETVDGSLFGRYDPDESRFNEAAMRLRYRADGMRRIYATWRYTRDAREQGDIGFTWPVSHQTALFARWNYSFHDNRTLDSFAGVRYDSCCWGVQAALRRYLPGRDSTRYDNAVMLVFELKGLSSIGQRSNIDELLDLVGR